MAPAARQFTKKSSWVGFEPTSAASAPSSPRMTPKIGCEAFRLCHQTNQKKRARSMARVISSTAVATNPGDAGDTSTLGAAKAGGVVLGGVAVALDANVGQAFIADCSRHTEGLLCDDEIKAKWQLSAEYWRGLANNTPLLQAVRAERDRRIANGDAAREAAQRHLAKAPDVLGGILTDEQ